MNPRLCQPETCPACGIVFAVKTTPNPATGKNMGKLCPNGHWTSCTTLCVAKRLPKSIRPKRLTSIDLHELGVKSEADALHLALGTMVECYERAISTLPKSSFTRAMVVGAFGKAPEVSRRVLGVGE